jgi:large subunit ribosomal protein L18
MAKRKIKPTRKMQFRRRREGKTDYNKRLSLLKSGKPRIVVRKSLSYITAQIVGYDEKGDKTLAGVNSKVLKDKGWTFACNNIPASYLAGLMLGKIAKEKGIKEAILDIGLYTSTKGAKIYAAVKGVNDAGVYVPFDESVAPSEERITGEHISSYSDKFKDMPKKFKEVKAVIEKGE